MNLRPLVDTHNDFEWMGGVCYEPAPINSRTLRNRRRVRIIFTALAILSVVTGVLYALSN